MSTSFTEFCDDILLFCADAQTGPRRKSIDIGEVSREHFPETPPTWVETVVKELVRKGYGKDWSTTKTRVFYIEGAGLERAERIREERQPKTLVQRATGDTSQKMINLGNLFVALLALIVAAIALLRSG